MKPKVEFRPIILAGGSGTRFWPRSRRWRAKQLLVLDGTRTMIQSTVDRLGNLATSNELWVITNDLLSKAISEQLHTMLGEQIICEPAARNTAPAAGLAAFLGFVVIAFASGCFGAIEIPNPAAVSTVSMICK